MPGLRISRWILAVGFSASLAAMGSASHAQDFFSAFFGSLSGSRQAPAVSLPFAAPESSPNSSFSRGRISYGISEQAYCVRTCDGRYFPISATGAQSHASICKSFCPASPTNVVYGSNIDDAQTGSGKSYSDLPNAFRYRGELVPGCTCNGKDQVGLAPVKIEDDPTLRRGDIVAKDNGLMVATRTAERKGGSLAFSPASEKIRSRYDRVPVLASE